MNRSQQAHKTERRTRRTTKSARGRGNGRTKHERALTSVARDTGLKMESKLRKRPYLGVALVVGATLVAAEAIGVGELALALASGYAAFRWLRHRVRPERAVRDAFAAEEATSAA